MNFLCRLKGHVPILELYAIPKGRVSPSGLFVNGVTAVFAINYYGAKIRCARCGQILADKSQEELR